MAQIMRFSLLLLFMTVTLTASYGQDSLAIVVAEKGDGIFSLLRKQGIDPSQHYQDFLALNKENIREGKHLYEGMEYYLPVPTDSVIPVNSDTEEEG
ncbi:MAG: N-acetylmuramoyl-L-alanine amidase, partial [Eudoraea sp.]|nr:N-acetylmuramoyl-L-alanine amidase [Eudoraea sp.]